MDRSKLLRSARSRALQRLRIAHNRHYQQLMDEEVAKLGGEPRGTKHKYAPRGEESPYDN